MQDGRQKGEVQLAFTFQSSDHSSSSPHDSQANFDVFQAQQPSPSRRAESARTTADSSADNSLQTHKGKAEPALLSELPDDGLGPLGHSFMTLAMTHITPSQPDSAETLDDHKYLKLASQPHSSSERSGPSAPASTLDPVAAAASVPHVQPQRRNFYPEEASDEEADLPSHHQDSVAMSLPAMPMEFRCQQTPAESNAGPSSTAAATCTLDDGSYSAQEVYHTYSARQSDGSQYGYNHSVPYGAHRDQQQGQGYEQQPQVPQWRLLGTSPLHEGQQHMQGQISGQQPQGPVQGREQQPQVPQWRLLGTNPLHEGQRQSQVEPQAHSWVQGQGSEQGYQQQPQAQQQGYEHEVQRPDWHLMGSPPLHTGYSGNDSVSHTSHSFSSQGKGSPVRPLTYASMAVGSWSDKAKRMVSPAGQPSNTQVST